MLSLGVHPKVVQEMLGHINQHDNGYLLTYLAGYAAGCREQTENPSHEARRRQDL